MTERTNPSVPGHFEDEDGHSNVPEHLRAATTRLQFPPSYVIVGIHRLFTDDKLYIPAWQKCKHGVLRGACVGVAWAAATYKIQKYFVIMFLIKSPRVTGLSRDGIFGFQVPFDLPTYATLLFVSTQLTFIFTFFLSRNLRIARDRVYAQTIASRGKGPDFWHPYVEEWDTPPRVSRRGCGGFLGRILAGPVGRILVKVALLPFDIVPVAGMIISAWLRSLGTARYLHKPYFQAKGMSEAQVAVFVEERKWDYRVFGFTAALLERLPIIGLVFSISNRIGAAMWAHDLEKRQHYVEEQKAIKTRGRKSIER